MFPWDKVFDLAILIVGGWFAHRATSPKAHDVAEQLDAIAKGAAALAVSLYPDADWATLLNHVVQQISQAAGLKVKDAAAIERAASLALTQLGKNPGKVE